MCFKNVMDMSRNRSIANGMHPRTIFFVLKSRKGPTDERARAEIGFAPRYAVRDIVEELHAHREEYGDFSKEVFYNIQVFKQLER